jgi:hypothetical protein
MISVVSSSTSSSTPSRFSFSSSIGFLFYQVRVA